LAALGVLHGLQNTFGGTYADNFSLPGTQSNTGLEVLSAHAPTAGGISAQVVMPDPKGLAAFSTQVDQAVTALQHMQHVLSASNPLSGGGGLSANGQI